MDRNTVVEKFPDEDGSIVEASSDKADRKIDFGIGLREKVWGINAVFPKFRFCSPQRCKIHRVRCSFDKVQIKMRYQLEIFVPHPSLRGAFSPRIVILETY